MSEPAILTDEQITTSVVFAEGSVRPSEGIPFSTFESPLTVNIDLKNDEYPNAPQLGKVDIIDEVSENIGSYEVYYLKVRFKPMSTMGAKDHVILYSHIHACNL